VSGAAPARTRCTGIVALAPSGLMGRGLALPWHWPEDLKHFKRSTLGHVLVMGRATYQSLLEQFGGPLERRTTLVVSRALGGAGPDGALREGARWFATLSGALDWAHRAGAEEVFLAGGAQIYRLAFEELSEPPGRFLVTWVPEVPCQPGDTFFPFRPSEDFFRERYDEADSWTDASGQLRFVDYRLREPRPEGEGRA
jgi:dihydrofolate reductase